MTQAAAGPARDTAHDWHGPAHAPPVVLVHGLGLNRGMWRWQLPFLVDRYRVLTYDLYGHGGSAAPPETPSLTLFARQLARLMDAQAIGAAALVGFSLGGMIVRRFVQDFPARVRALAILNSAHARSPRAQAAVAERVAQVERAGPSATVEAALERWFTCGFRRERPDVMDLVRRWIMANDPAVYPQVYRVLLEGVEEVVRPDPPIAAPTLVMAAEEDHGNSPEMARAIAGEIGGAETIILPGLRHMALSECPQAVGEALVAFLDRVHGCQEGT